MRVWNWNVYGVRGVVCWLRGGCGVAPICRHFACRCHRDRQCLCGFPAHPVGCVVTSNPQVAGAIPAGRTRNQGVAGLLEYRHDLLDTKALSFHSLLLPHPGGDYAGNSPANWHQIRGADHSLGVLGSPFRSSKTTVCEAHVVIQLESLAVFSRKEQRAERYRRRLVRPQAFC